ncbi:MAG TPA: ATP-binding protein [Desulfomonilaceae bacterium]|nr:ATP-binding protein [Desulfomonilaceae bacterium]
MIELPVTAFLESFPEEACLIGQNGRILQVNSRLKSLDATVVGKKCHEALAGIADACSFCPLDEMLNGLARPVCDAVHVRWEKTCCVNVRFLPGMGKKGFVLETFRDLAECRAPGDNKDSGEMLPDLLKKLTGLLMISRGLMGGAPFDSKMELALKHLVKSLNGSSGVIAWAEIDDRLYGNRPQEVVGQLSTHEIKVEGKFRGRLFVNWPTDRDIRFEEKYFLEESTDLIGRQVEISDLWERLRHSEERYKKLAGNLAKEMWTRTEALAKETGYLEGILRCCEDMIITTDLDSRIVEFNPGAERLLGFSAEEIQGKNINDIWVDADERDKLMEEVVLTGGIRNYQTRLRTKSGEFREISLSLSLLKDEEGRLLGTVGVSKDISVENAIRRELERLNQNFREAIHFINHETKNSLVVMGGFLRRLIQGEEEPVRRDQLQIVYHHTKFLEAMSRDFLVMAELEHGEFQIRKQHITNFYDEVILPAMIGLKERYPDSFESYDESMGGVGVIQLEGDPALLEIVYRNLFGNALKYRHPASKIAYGVVDLGDRYLFNVWNEGPGVPKEQVEKIFQKFYRVLDETTRGKRGTGLGLYNIRNIVEAHGGRIWCETDPGRWINFLFELPK